MDKFVKSYAKNMKPKDADTDVKGTKLNNDITYNKLPSKQSLQTSGEYSEGVDMGLSQPVNSDAYLYFMKNRGKPNKTYDNFRANTIDALQPTMNKAGDFMRKLMDIGSAKYNEDDGEYYIGNKRVGGIDYHLMPDVFANKLAEGLRKK